MIAAVAFFVTCVGVRASQAGNTEWWLLFAGLIVAVTVAVYEVIDWLKATVILNDSFLEWRGIKTKTIPLNELRVIYVSSYYITFKGCKNRIVISRGFTELAEVRAAVRELSEMRPDIQVRGL